MRFATVASDARASVAIVRDGLFLPLAGVEAGLASIRGIAASGPDGLRRVSAWVERQPERAWRAVDGIELGPAVPDPGAIYTIGLNYREPGDAPDARPERPLVYGKAPTSVAGHGAALAWDRSLTGNVDAEAELGVVIGAAAANIAPKDALGHVFGYTCINDVSSRDAWLDGDQWLLGKSMPGFCPVGPWVVTPDEVGTGPLRLGCTINGVPVQDGSTAAMRTPVADLIAYLSRHVPLRPGDLIATGTPARLAGPIGPDRHLQAGDVVSVWIERIGELTTRIA